MHTIVRALIPLALIVPAAVIAQASPDATAVKAGSYAIDPNHTLVQFSVNHFGFNDYFGTLPGATGTMTLDPKRIAATKVDVSLPVERISTTNATLDGELKSADWFDAAKYPTIRFVSQSVTRTGPRTAKISGTVTMHGLSKPMVLDATFGGAGVNPLSKAYTAGFKATGTLKRSEFGVTKYVPLVGDAVTLSITAAFEQK
ncbi:MAG: polyisoprenoid-binding protein [Sphingomonas sp.]|nr:MAG: polyisoprenoid-binding protein [Sphingomonas sp.]